MHFSVIFNELIYFPVTFYLLKKLVLITFGYLRLSPALHQQYGLKVVYYFKILEL